MAGFQGDRGKDLLGGTNIRALVPYFIEKPDGETVVNEGLEMQQGGGGRVKSGKKKGAKAASTNTEDHSGRGQAQDNRAGAVRTFAVTQRPPPPPPQTTASLAALGKWAGGAFLNSPAPSSLPMPMMMGHHDGHANPALLDPAIVGSSRAPAPQQQTGLHPGVGAGTRLVARFGDGEWYQGVVASRTANSAMILFEGYEHEGAYEIEARDIRAPQAQPAQHHPKHPHQHHTGLLPDPSIIQQSSRAPPPSSHPPHPPHPGVLPHPAR
ncbi:hypothetical protein T484DRAFT_1911542, partial [Baffinella frigidus]